MQKKRRRSRRNRKRRQIIILFLEIFVMVLLFVVLFVVYKLDKADTGNKTSVVKAKVNEEVEEQLETIEEDEWKMDGYTNIALFGVDSRDSNLDKGARSDTIMVASLNNTTGEVKLCSIFRDTYCNIGNDTYNKANSAYAAGGPDQAVQMLNTNLDMDIEQYVTVNFWALIDIINDVGGVEIDVTEEEIHFLNDYQTTMSEESGRKMTKVKKPGLQTLDGMQAVAYCRIRYTKGDDFKRAERQRLVLTQVANKARSASVEELNAIIDDVLPEIKTSFSKAELVEYAAKAATYSIAEQSGFPFERVTGAMGKAGSAVVAEDFAQNVKEFHEFLFGDSEYTPSQAVQNISSKIAADRQKNGL
ncbi:MAG: LCP family protein [Lachnospiraceae bacterium]|nr:LCP family protein [Lachnospiraceae bacterium]